MEDTALILQQIVSVKVTSHRFSKNKILYFFASYCSLQEIQIRFITETESSNTHKAA